MTDGAVFPHGKTWCDREGHHLHVEAHDGWFCHTCGWTPWNGEDVIFTAGQVRRLMGGRTDG